MIVYVIGGYYAALRTYGMVVVVSLFHTKNNM